MKCLLPKSGIMIPILMLVFVMSITACGGGSGEAPAADLSKSETTATSQKATKAEMDNTEDKSVPGWQQASYENYRFSLPKDWKGDGDTGIWCPGDQNLDMGRPKLSMHIGAIPVMPGSTVADKLNFYYGGAPTTTGEIKKCGMSGKFVKVTIHGLKHLGLILEDNAGMKIVNFFDCQAPADKFDQYQETFKKILNSVGCK